MHIAPLLEAAFVKIRFKSEYCTENTVPKVHFSFSVVRLLSVLTL
jgi:hypothetical protein